MKTLVNALALTLLLGFQGAFGDTYKCTQGGKTVFSDIPCAAGASRVDEGSDKISKDSRRQAEYVNQKNSSQLSELEYRAARDRSYRGGVAEVPTDTPAPRARPNSR